MGEQQRQNHIGVADADLTAVGGCHRDDGVHTVDIAEISDDKIDIFGKFADFFGPMIMSFCALVLGSSTYGILGLLLLFVVGYILLRKIPENQEK